MNKQVRIICNDCDLSQVRNDTMDIYTVDELITAATKKLRTRGECEHLHITIEKEVE